MQGRLARTIRYGILYAIGAATIGTALFSGCSTKNFPNSKKDDLVVRQDEYSHSNIEILTEGPELINPRENMGLNNLEQKIEVQEPVKQYQTQATEKVVIPEPTQSMNPVYQPSPQNYPANPISQQPNAQPAQLPNYPAQPLKPIQRNKNNDYKDPRIIAPKSIIPRTDDWTPNSSRGFQRIERSNY